MRTTFSFSFVCGFQFQLKLKLGNRKLKTVISNRLFEIVSGSSSVRISSTPAAVLAHDEAVGEVEDMPPRCPMFVSRTTPLGKHRFRVSGRRESLMWFYVSESVRLSSAILKLDGPINRDVC